MYNNLMEKAINGKGSKWKRILMEKVLNGKASKRKTDLLDKGLKVLLAFFLQTGRGSK